jgi:hypothetical protein
MTMAQTPSSAESKSWCSQEHQLLINNCYLDFALTRRIVIMFVDWSCAYNLLKKLDSVLILTFPRSPIQYVSKD